MRIEASAPVCADVPAGRDRPQAAGGRGARFALFAGGHAHAELAAARVGELARAQRAHAEAGGHVAVGQAEGPQHESAALALGQRGQCELGGSRYLGEQRRFLGRLDRVGVVGLGELDQARLHAAQLALVEAVPHDPGEVARRVALDRRRLGAPGDLQPRVLVGVVGRLVEVVERVLAGPPGARQEAPPGRCAEAHEVPFGVERRRLAGAASAAIGLRPPNVVGSARLRPIRPALSSRGAPAARRPRLTECLMDSRGVPGCQGGGAILTACGHGRRTPARRHR